MSPTDTLPVLLGALAVAAAALYALLPLLLPAPAEPSTTEGTDPTAERFALYRQVLDLEFDRETGKLSPEDFKRASDALLARAAQLLQASGSAGAAEGGVDPHLDLDLDAALEREIAAARRALAGERRPDPEAVVA